MTADDVAAQRRQLAALHAAGYLTDDEFHSKEAALSDRPAGPRVSEPLSVGGSVGDQRRTFDRRSFKWLAWGLVGSGLAVTLVSLAAGQRDGPTYWAGIVLAAIGLAPQAFKRDNGGSEAKLGHATVNWTQPTVFRTYQNSGGGRRTAGVEAAILAAHGYRIATQSGTGGHINVGRTVAPAVLTGGLSLLFGASRSKDALTITFTRVA